MTRREDATARGDEGVRRERGRGEDARRGSCALLGRGAERATAEQARVAASDASRPRLALCAAEATLESSSAVRRREGRGPQRRREDDDSSASSERRRRLASQTDWRHAQTFDRRRRRARPRRRRSPPPPLSSAARNAHGASTHAHTGSGHTRNTDRGDRPKPLLARRVPDLQLHFLAAVERDGLDLEVDAAASIENTPTKRNHRAERPGRRFGGAAQESGRGAVGASGRSYERPSARRSVGRIHDAPATRGERARAPRGRRLGRHTHAHDMRA